MNRGRSIWCRQGFKVAGFKIALVWNVYDTKHPDLKVQLCSSLKIFKFTYSILHISESDFQLNLSSNLRARFNNPDAIAYWLNQI